MSIDAVHLACNLMIASEKKNSYTGISNLFIDNYVTKTAVALNNYEYQYSSINRNTWSVKAERNIEAYNQKGSTSLIRV